MTRRWCTEKIDIRRVKYRWLAEIEWGRVVVLGYTDRTLVFATATRKRRYGRIRAHRKALKGALEYVMHGVTHIVDGGFVAQRIGVAVEHDDELVLCTDSNRQQRAIFAGELQTI